MLKYSGAWRANDAGRAMHSTAVWRFLLMSLTVSMNTAWRDGGGVGRCGCVSSSDVPWGRRGGLATPPMPGHTARHTNTHTRLHTDVTDT